MRSRTIVFAIGSILASGFSPFAAPAHAQEKILIIRDGSVEVETINSRLERRGTGNQKWKWNAKAKSISIVKGATLPERCEGGEVISFDELTVIVGTKQPGQVYDIEGRNKFSTMALFGLFGFSEKLNLELYGDIQLTAGGTNKWLVRTTAGDDVDIIIASARQRVFRESRAVLRQEMEKTCVRISNYSPQQVGRPARAK